MSYPLIHFLIVVLIHFHFFCLLNGQQTSATKYFLEKTNIKVKPLNFQTARNGQLLTSNVEMFRDLYASSKVLLGQQYENDFARNYKYIVKTGRVQKPLGPDEPFPCNLNNTRSSELPSSVHKLRPGDISIIGAMGDSLTAGNAIMSKTFPQILVEFRGLTFLGGGLKDWRTYLTLPNILKVFNPNLYGQSIANTLAKFREARFNVAEPLALVQDLPYMAEVLVKRMQNDPRVDMAKDWKMISILMGANDICNEMCYYDKKEDFLENHRKDLHRTLTILRDNIPRLMVNVIVLPDVYAILKANSANNPAYCNALYKVSCHCLIGNSISAKLLASRRKIIERIQQIEMEVSALDEFQLEEFTVVPRTFGVNVTVRMLENGGGSDLKYFAIDCFHFSQYGQAALANMLWNDMLQVESMQSSSSILRPFEKFACPTEEKPFIKTLKNS